MSKWFTGLLVLALLFSSFVLSSTRVEASNSEHACQKPTTSTTPTATPTPEATPSATPTDTPHQDVSDGLSSNHDATIPHAATCTIAFDAPLLQGFTRVTPTSVAFSWWGVADIDKYALLYGYSPDALVYGVDNIGADATSLTIGSLEPNRTVWAQLLAYKGGCASYSAIIDP